MTTRLDIVTPHRLGWPAADVRAKWFERMQGGSRFQVLSWVPAYPRRYLAAFATTFLRLSPNRAERRSAWKTAK